MKRIGKLLAIVLSVGLALTVLTGCDKTEYVYIYNTIVSPAAEPDPITVYYVQVINERYSRIRDDATPPDKYGEKPFGEPLTVLASAELDQKAKEAAALTEKGMDERDALREVMKDYEEKEVFYSTDQLSRIVPPEDIYTSFSSAETIALNERTSVGGLNHVWYPAYTVGTATYTGNEGPFRLVLIVAHHK